MIINIRRYLESNKIFLINAAITFLVFLLIFLAYYPGIITYDGDYQWQQVQSKLINDAHPFFSTYFMYLLSKICNTITIVLIFQMLLFSIIWGYFCQLIKCNKKQEIIKTIFTLVMSFIPIICIYSITLWKDILYTYYLFGISVLIYKGYVKEYKVYDYILFGFLLSMIFSYRHNGMIVAVLLFIVLFFSILKKYSKQKKEGIKKTLIILLTFVLIIAAIAIPQKKYLAKTKTNNNQAELSIVESYMLWYFGAYVKNDKSISKKDLKFLDNIIPLDEWKKIYNPYIINSTNTYNGINKKFIKQNNSEFKSLFIKLVVNNPKVLFVHYLKADSLIINPISIKYGYVYMYDFSEWKPVGFMSKTNSKIPILTKAYNYAIRISVRDPIIYLNQPALWLYVSIILCIILAKKIYGRKIWLIISPMICNSLSLLPINLAQDLRYVYINFPTVIALVLLCIINYKKIFERVDKNEKSKKHIKLKTI